MSTGIEWFILSPLTPLATRQAVAPRWGYDCVVVFYLPVFPDQSSKLLLKLGLLGLRLE
jgi:hypothetical protein